MFKNIFSIHTYLIQLCHDSKKNIFFYFDEQNFKVPKICSEKVTSFIFLLLPPRTAKNKDIVLEFYTLAAGKWFYNIPGGKKYITSFDVYMPGQ